LKWDPSWGEEVTLIVEREDGVIFDVDVFATISPSFEIEAARRQK
jgi:hypothetical protein